MSETPTYVKNPQTNRDVKVNSKTYRRLIKEGILKEETPTLLEQEESESYLAESEVSDVEAYTDDSSLESNEEFPDEEESIGNSTNSNDSDVDEWIASMNDEDMHKLYDYVNLLRKK